VRRAVGEGAGKGVEQFAHLFLTDCRTPCAEDRHGLTRRPKRQSRTWVAIVQSGLSIPQPTLRPRHELVPVAHRFLLASFGGASADYRHANSDTWSDMR